MTLRYDDHRRPRGLNWSVCNDGNPQPWIWSNWSQPKTKKRNPIKNPGVGYGGATRVPVEIEREVIRKYEETDETPKQIGAQFNISRQAVYKILIRNGIETRTRSEAMQLARRAS